MKLRRANDADLHFLRAMIVQAAFPPGRTPPLEEAEEAFPVGAAWCRRFIGTETGLSGFIDGNTPVLAIAVADGHRGRGIGAALLDGLVAAARAEGVARLSLSVGRTNPALRLYERLGWERLKDAPDRPLRLLRRL